MERPPDERETRETESLPPASPQSPATGPSPPVGERLPEQASAPPAYGQPQYGPYYGPPPYQPYVKPKANGLAIASMVLGIVGMVLYMTFILAFLGAIAAILGLIFGMVSKGQIDKSAGTQGGRGFAITGIVLGWVGVGFLLLFILFFGGLLGCSALVSGS